MSRFAYYFITFIFKATLRPFTVTLFCHHKNNAYNFIASDNFLKVVGVSGTRRGFLILLSIASKVPIYYSPVA